jgi:hypothetical protein
MLVWFAVHILSSEVTAREEVIKQAAEVIADLDW